MTAVLMWIWYLKCVRICCRYCHRSRPRDRRPATLPRHQIRHRGSLPRRHPRSTLATSSISRWSLDAPCLSLRFVKTLIANWQPSTSFVAIPCSSHVEVNGLAISSKMDSIPSSMDASSPLHFCLNQVSYLYFYGLKTVQVWFRTDSCSWYASTRSSSVCCDCPFDQIKNFTGFSVTTFSYPSASLINC